MSIKKELLNELSEKQLMELAEDKGIQFNLNKIRKKYYVDWADKEKIVDIMSDHKDLSLIEIEEYIKIKK